MHPSFNIRSENGHSSEKQLFVEAGSQGISFVALDPLSKSFTDIVCYHFQQGLTDEALAENCKEIFAEESLLRGQFKKTDIVFSFPENILTPNEVFGSISNDQMLDDIFGDAIETKLRTDFLYKHNLHNVYRVPVLVNNVVESQFPFANYSHACSLLPDALQEDGLFAIFYPNVVTVLLRKAKQLIVLQTFSYATAEDAAYHLLNVCKSFDAAVDETNLQLHGMIDKNSALYNELYKYFINIGFGELPTGFNYPTALEEQPAHYFNHLFATAACV